MLGDLSGVHDWQYDDMSEETVYTNRSGSYLWRLTNLEWLRLCSLIRRWRCNIVRSPSLVLCNFACISQHLFDIVGLDICIWRSVAYDRIQARSIDDGYIDRTLVNFQDKFEIMWKESKQIFFFKMRPSWHEYFLQIAQLTSQRSNCCKRKVGAVVVKQNRILGLG